MSGQIKQHGNSRYSAQTAGYICWQLTEGRSLRAICREDGMPAQNAVFRWIEANESFRQQYARARELQAHVLADEALAIADDPTGDYREEDGRKIPDYENVQRARLRVDARRWMAGKLLPKVYGDKLLHTGADGEGPIAVKVKHDYSLLTGPEMVQLLALLEKCTPKQAAIEGPTIEGEVEE